MYVWADGLQLVIISTINGSMYHVDSAWTGFFFLENDSSRR